MKPVIIYKAMINDFFVSELEDLDLDELLFQSDGAKCHTVNDSINLLKGIFGEHIISPHGLVT